MHQEACYVWGLAASANPMNLVVNRHLGDGKVEECFIGILYIAVGNLTAEKKCWAKMFNFLELHRCLRYKQIFYWLLSN